MTIAELLAATGLTANDLVPIWDAEAAQNVEQTQKVTATQLAAAVKVLASLVNTTEMNTAIAQSTASSYVIWGAQGQSSGYLRLARCGKVRLLSLEDVAIPSGANFIIDELPEGDRPGFLTVSSLYAGGSSASIWVRTSGTFGTAGTAGHTINGQIVWFAV